MKVKVLNGERVIFWGNVDSFNTFREILLNLENITKIIGFEKLISNELKNLEFDRLQKVLDQYGYKDLGDVQYWHSQDPNDPEPKGLLNWYSAYDDAIWNEIDSLNEKSFEELQNYDPVAVEQKIFEETKNKLPKEV